MRKQVVKVISWVMLVVFLIGVAPREYVHGLLYDHTDTVHRIYKKGEIVINNKHIHCSFLGFVFAPYIATEKQFLSFREFACYTHYLQPVYSYRYSSCHKIVSLRGPPCNC